MDNFKRDVGKRIAECRKKKNYKQNDLCNIIDGSTPQMISNWEQGHSCPSPFYLVILANALDTTIDYLLLGKRQNALDDRPDKRTILKTITSLHLSGSSSISIKMDKRTLSEYVECCIRDSEIISFWDNLEKLNDARQVLGDQVYYEQVKKLIDLYSK